MVLLRSQAQPTPEENQPDIIKAKIRNLEDFRAWALNRAADAPAETIIEQFDDAYKNNRAVREAALPVIAKYRGCNPATAPRLGR